MSFVAHAYYRLNDQRGDPWPQTWAVVRPDLGLMLAIAGGGGGSVQALFRDPLLEYVEGAVERSEPRASALPLPARLDALEAEVQRSFMLSKDLAADHYQATWVAVLHERGECAVSSHGTERAYLYQAGSLKQVSKDKTLGTEAAAKGVRLDEAHAFMRDFHVSGFGQWLAKPEHRAARARFHWDPSAVLLLFTGGEPDHAGPDVLSRALPSALTELDEARVPQRMYEQVHASMTGTDRESTARRYKLERQGVVLIARRPGQP